MVERGTGLSSRARAARRRQARAAAERDTRAARLGVSLRSILVSPGSGFGDYLREVKSRPGSGRITAILLGGVLGASLWLFWLKLNGLLDLRRTSCEFKWSYLAGAVLIGALAGILAGLLWGGLGGLAARRMGGKGSAGDLRLVWGAASIPHFAALLLLLPLDLLLVGADAYRAVESEAAGGTVWRAMSVAFAAALLVWSLWLLFRGAETVTRLAPGRAVWLVVLAVACLALPVVPLIVAGSGGAACPT